MKRKRRREGKKRYRKTKRNRKREGKKRYRRKQRVYTHIKKIREIKGRGREREEGNKPGRRG